MYSTYPNYTNDMAVEEQSEKELQRKMANETAKGLKNYTEPTILERLRDRG